MNVENLPDNMGAVLTFKPCTNLANSTTTTVAARPPSASAIDYGILSVSVPLKFFPAVGEVSAYWGCP